MKAKLFKVDTEYESLYFENSAGTRKSFNQVKRRWIVRLFLILDFFGLTQKNMDNA